jgi:hypothetical protein
MKFTVLFWKVASGLLFAVILTVAIVGVYHELQLDYAMQQAAR